MAEREPVARREGARLSVRLSGAPDYHDVGAVWREIDGELRAGDLESVAVDASALERCPGAVLGLLFRLKEEAARRNLACEVEGLGEERRRILDEYDADRGKEQPEGDRSRDLVEGLGRRGQGAWRDLAGQVEFVGALTLGLGEALLRPARLRWRDLWMAAEACGANAVPIVSMVAFLFGLIMAFQSAIPMQNFGVEIYVADLIGIGMLRELGALITAVVLAGRTGSAYAAELGTMKVNEEIDALTTMGLDPIRFLVVPRVLAVMLMTPLLTMYAILLGLAGGAVVILSLGYPLAAYYQHVFAIVGLVDYAGGMLKCFVFGFLVAGIGCLRGLQTGSGARAVGNAATSAVVTSIVAIIIADMIFAVLSFILGV